MLMRVWCIKHDAPRAQFEASSSKLGPGLGYMTQIGSISGLSCGNQEVYLQWSWRPTLALATPRHFLSACRLPQCLVMLIQSTSMQRPACRQKVSGGGGRRGVGAIPHVSAYFLDSPHLSPQCCKYIFSAFLFRSFHTNLITNCMRW